MNKQEVLYLPVKKEGFIFSTDSDKCKRYYRTLDGEEVSSSFKAKSKEELLDQLKPAVPKFVAEWIESKKESFSDSSAIYMYDNLTLDNNGGHYHDVWLWAIAHHHDFIKAWHDGYTVEKEKLYTVEIPNPNSKSNHKIYLCKDDNTGKVYLCKGNFNHSKNKNLKLLKLTEAEIKKDFYFLWMFAKRVEEN